MDASRQRLEAEALEKRRQESRAEVGERRVATRDDYSAILSFLDRLDRCIALSILTMNEGAREQLITSRVVEMTNTVVKQLTQLGENADYAIAMQRGTTDQIRSSMVQIHDQMLELRLEMSLAFGFTDIEPGDELATKAKSRADWFNGEIDRPRNSVRRELGVG
ncbi:hypothetical protein BA895_16940 [Humibacillus sp. DSM 29435]|uniref:hypothetical protein n=1 Tax=Humibacillus sp. DSM 29435 TaxID=1869167 RepID=UPI0008733BB2|nr:hypothetical protein [Humibacillus sp. DSM 29435]OFE17155.1 hypothetical protein BA895_16940 [Humibacillus sp. DSM 29435]